MMLEALDLVVRTYGLQAAGKAFALAQKIEAIAAERQGEVES